MNYQRIYEQLTAKDMIAEYTEKHHIIPKCMGGTNHLSNLVKLTPEAHYVAHQLLVKIYPDNHKLVYAAHMMTVDTNSSRVTNKCYGWIKRRQSSALSTDNKGKTLSATTRAKMSAYSKNRSLKHRTNLSMANTGKPKSNEHKAKIGAAQKGKAKPKVICPHCNKEGGISQIKRWHFNNCKSLLQT